MSFDSFYGGRMGASFVITRKFDGIDIPEETAGYGFKYCAVTSDKNHFYSYNGKFIEKNENNYTKYAWKPLIFDGETSYNTIVINPSTGEPSEDILPLVPSPAIKQEGMVQCFKKGGASTNEVNYGQYVIIDTLDKNNPENGKVYQRGMDYQGELGGAKYIGQIVGPQGDSPELSMNHYDIINSSADEHYVNKQTVEYTVDGGDLIPGYDPNKIGGNPFNNNIELISANIKDDYGNIYACTIGFKLPYLVLDFNAQVGSPYVTTDLIEPNSEEYQDGKWNHPFYEKWDLTIPQGKHGTSIRDLEIVHTMTRPAGHMGSEYPGAAVYIDPGCTQHYQEEGSDKYLSASVEVIPNYRISPLPAIISCYIINEGTYKEKFVKIEDCYQDALRYTEVDYERQGPPDDMPETTQKIAGPFNTILKVDVKEDGTGTVYYTNNNSDSFKIKTINSARINTGNPEGTGTQKLSVGFNDGSWDEIGNPINYIIEIAFNDKTAIRGDGVNILNHCLVYYSDPALRISLGGASTSTPGLPTRENWVKYPSRKYTTDPEDPFYWDQWVDLGPAVPATTKLTPLLNFSSTDDPITILGSTPPEQIKRTGEDEPINSEAYGWCVTKDDPTEEEPNRKLFYCFDYEKSRWYSVGHAIGGGGGLADPTSVIVKSEPDAENPTYPATADVANLQVNGFWFAVEKMYCGDI